VLYVENPTALRARLGEEGLEALTQVDGGIHEVEPRLRVMRLPIQIPGSRSSELIGAINGWRFANALKKRLRQDGWDDFIAWCRVPSSHHTLRHLSPKAVVYDVTDDYELYARSERERRLTERLEARMLKIADRVFTTTATLRAKMATSNDNVQVIPNGVDAVFFELPEAERDPLLHVPHPRIGFVGLIARWMDFELVRKLAARWPGHIVLVGPVQREVESVLRSIPGVVHVPKIAHMDVPRYLRSFDICMMPHETSELRHRADPLKVVEYLAVGKPIVSVSLRSLTQLGGLIDLANDHGEFLRMVEHRIDHPQPELRDERRAVARARSWDQLYDTILTAIAGLS